MCIHVDTAGCNATLVIPVFKDFTHVILLSYNPA